MGNCKAPCLGRILNFNIKKTHNQGLESKNHHPFLKKFKLFRLVTLDNTSKPLTQKSRQILWRPFYNSKTITKN
ncbi:TPA: hypothetical protein DGH83_02605 [Candidatus Peregrinibacteria bacterium]|nr:hypothetical protein [Candidatus Peregrinibacteria bacterium]